MFLFVCLLYLFVSLVEQRVQVISINQNAIRTAFYCLMNQSMMNNQIDELGNQITYLAVVPSTQIVCMIDNRFSWTLWHSNVRNFLIWLINRMETNRIDEKRYNNNWWQLFCIVTSADVRPLSISSILYSVHPCVKYYMIHRLFARQMQ